MSNDTDNKARIAALLEERRAYELHGTKEQVADVDAELKRIGFEGKAPAKRATTRKKA
jgi:hypothetical protein